MALQSSGTISLSDIATEFGDSAPHSMSEFYGAGGAPSSGQFKFSDMYGRANAQYMSATGGTVTTVGDYKIHTFNSSGTFTVTAQGNAAGSNSVEYVVIAGGGGAGGSGGGGGGAGGYRSSVSGESSGGGASAESAFVPSVTSYSVVVGGGGGGVSGFGSQGGKGSSSSVFGISTVGGGGGGGRQKHVNNANGNGGSGAGGGSNGNSTGYLGGAGTSGQGRNGANSTNTYNSPQGYYGTAGGGGGAANAGVKSYNYPYGGDGVTSSITGSAVDRAGGGHGCCYIAYNNTINYTIPTSNYGGGGVRVRDRGYNYPGYSGVANKGGGGGGANGTTAGAGGSGGSGVVIIRYKFQN